MIAFKKAAQAIKEAKAMVITAGAGMGVDSGLPDFRGDSGFWQAYPPYARLGLSFVDCANPDHFRRDPAFGWGFYGHRTNLYRKTVPHAGFQLLKKWAAAIDVEPFVVTSNVDGQFQKAGFDEGSIHEVHGSIHWLQCSTPCSNNIWRNNEQIEIDEQVMRAKKVPRCPGCGEVSRPNILMFGDWHWIGERSQEQEQRFLQYMAEHRLHRMVVIEMGAGSAVPTIRATSERIGWNCPEATVIRINPREPEIKSPHISIPLAALEALQAIDSRLN